MGGGGGGAGGTVSKRVVVNVLDKEYVGQRADEEVREVDVILVGAVSHEQLAARSSRADSASTLLSTIRLIVGLISRGKNRMRTRDSL